MTEHLEGKEEERDCSKAADSVEGSLLEERSSTKPLANTVSGTLDFEPYSSGHGREVAC